MSRGFIVAALLFLGLSGPVRAQDGGGAWVLDRVVATVDGQVISYSELELEARVALIQRGALRAAFAPLDEPALKDALELAIGLRLQAQEAEKLQAFVPEATESAAAVAHFKERFRSGEEYQAFLARHDADEPQLSALLSRATRAEKLLDSKVRLKAQVSETEVRRYFHAHAGELGRAYEEVRAALREKLIRDRYAQLASAELKALRRAADVRIVAPFGTRREAP